MTVLDEAIIFATQAHRGQARKMSATPYVLHPLEVASIIATMTSDLNTMAAGCLHDTVEDCGVDPLLIRAKFGNRVAALVASETEDTSSTAPRAETWQQRKEDSLQVLKVSKDREVKIMWLGDKLSNIRSFYREYVVIGDDLFKMLHQSDKKKQEWYYRTLGEYLSELSDTLAYKEYIDLVNRIFGEE